MIGPIILFVCVVVGMVADMGWKDTALALLALAGGFGLTFLMVYSSDY